MVHIFSLYHRSTNASVEEQVNIAGVEQNELWKDKKSNIIEEENNFIEEITYLLDRVLC